MILFISKEIFEVIKNCVDNALPYEACGFIFGDVKEIKIMGEFQYHYFSKKFDCIKSDVESYGSFIINDEEKFNDIYSKRSNEDLKLISIFHSHPVKAIPSGIDKENIKYLDEFKNIKGKKPFKHQIWTILGSDNKLNAYIYMKKKFYQINLVIIDISKELKDFTDILKE